MRDYLACAKHAFFQEILSLICALSPVRGMLGVKRAILHCMGVRTAGPVMVQRDSHFVGPALLELGKRVTLGGNASFICYAPVRIGDDFLAGADLMINSGSHEVATLVLANEPVTIGNRVWCGMRVTICAGVTIGDDVVIGAGSVVTKSLPGSVVAAGVPCKVIRAHDRSTAGPLWSPWEGMVS